MIATFQRNISQHCRAQHVAGVCPPCCDMLRGVALCWVFLTQILKWSNLSCNICGYCMMLWSFGQVRAAMLHPGMCTIVRFSIPNMSQRVATGWPNACNMLRPTMLRSFGRSLQMLSQQCCRMCCVYMLRSFGRGRLFFSRGFHSRHEQRTTRSLALAESACLIRIT